MNIIKHKPPTGKDKSSFFNELAELVKRAAEAGGGVLIEKKDFDVSYPANKIRQAMLGRGVKVRVEKHEADALWVSRVENFSWVGTGDDTDPKPTPINETYPTAASINSTNT